MDIAFVNKCYDIFENQNIEKEQESIFFKSKEDYITKSHNQLFYKIQSTFTNKSQKIGIIKKVTKVYNTDETINENCLIIDYNGQNLDDKDLLKINNTYVFVREIISPCKISIFVLKTDKSPFKLIVENEIIFKIDNYKKFHRMYTSILHSNKNILRNLYNPSANLTKLMNTSMKSDFWNQQQRNILCNVIKNTENKKIHVINGDTNTGKSTIILGLIQNYLSRYENIKILVTSSNKKSLINIASRLISQMNILIPNNKWLMIVGDKRTTPMDLHPFLISTYVDNYKHTLSIIEQLLNKLSNITLDKNPTLIQIVNKLEELPINPYSHNETTITKLISECNSSNQDDMDNLIIQSQLIIDKWTNHQFVNNKLLRNCNLVLSTICSSGCPSMELYDNNIVMIDDADQTPEIESLIPLQNSTEQLLLFGNSNKNNEQLTLFKRMMSGGCSVHQLLTSY